MSAKRVLVYVQHLLGIGHLKRAATLARALADESLEVTMVSGGQVVPGVAPAGVHWIQLPPAAAADAQFKGLVDETGRPVDDAWRAQRREALLRAWHAVAPQVIVIELFPFGRRQMRFELLPWLDAVTSATERPVLVSSVRDVLGGGQRNRARQDEMLALFERYFDHLLVHGDPGLVAFERTFCHAAAIGPRLHYTGYVVDRAQRAQGSGDAGRGEVIVSAGGGAVGLRLLETAMRCRSSTRLAERTWRVLAGVNVTAEAWRRLTAVAEEVGGGHVLLERSRDDFPELLANCVLSISQAGYNTLMEIVDAGARAVVVPFAGVAETEQTLRAHLLAARGRLECLDEAALTPQSLAEAVDRASALPRPPRGGVDLDGARASARLIADWAGRLPW